MTAEIFITSMLNGLSYGLLLFLLSSGLTLIFSMMGVLNFAHASFYMVGAYIGYQISTGLFFLLTVQLPSIGWLPIPVSVYAFLSVKSFWVALIVAPLLVGLLGAAFEKYALRKVHQYGHVPELLITFGLSYIILEVVQLIWGRSAVAFNPPEALQGPLFSLINHSQNGLSMVMGKASPEMCTAVGEGIRVTCSNFPATRGFLMFVAVVMLIAVWLMLTRTRIGLVIQAALTHPDTVEALGHNVPRVFMMVFGAGAALAGLAGVVGGATFVTEPAMAAAVGSVIFVVVVVGGLGSLSGAFLASLLIGVIQTFAVAFDQSLISLAQVLGIELSEAMKNNSVIKLTISQVAPILPYLFLVLVLIFRPKGLLGTREG